MKRLLGFIGALALLVMVSSMGHAAVPKGYNPNGSPYNASINISSQPAASAANVVYNISVSSSQGVSCSVCLTRLMTSLTTATSFYVWDNGTTNYIITGIGLGSTNNTPVTLNMPWNAGEPMCFPAGDTVSFNTVGQGATPSYWNVEGYTDCGYSRNGGR